ncbi:hypothetical protein Pelo_19636 [Pelomyxa schiedti]|nr:hypothetical protein Pelo_19636 [Pelomyxa schiedti]
MVSSAISETTFVDVVYHTSHTEAAVATTRPTDTSTDRSTPLSVARATALATLRGFLASLRHGCVTAAGLVPEAEMVDCARGTRLHVELETEIMLAGCSFRDSTDLEGQGLMEPLVVVKNVVDKSTKQEVDSSKN